MKIIDLKNKNMSFERNGKLCKVLSFNKDKMEVEVECGGKKDKVVFAQLPKSIKKELNPL